MSSICFNYMELNGSEKNLTIVEECIKDMVQRQKTQTLKMGVFETLVGISDSFETREQYEQDSYNNNMTYWGVPYDLEPDDELNMYKNGSTLVISLQTNHSPCDSFFVNLCRIYQLHGYIIYDNEEMDFYGKTTYNEDGTFEDMCYLYLCGQYFYNPDDFWENIYNNQFEYWYEEDTDVDAEVAENFDYLTDEDKRELIKSYNEYKNQ